MAYYSEEWTEGEELIAMLGGREHLSLFLGVRSVSMLRYFGRKNPQSFCTVRFEIEGETGYDTVLEIRFNDFRADISLTECKKKWFRTFEVYIAQRTLYLSRRFYAFLTDPLSDLDPAELISAIDAVTNRSLDPFGMLG